MVYKVYLVDTFGEEYWVYNFSSREDAVAFMDKNNVENLKYIIKEVDE